MYEIKRSERLVKGSTVETWIAEFSSCNVLEVEVGTTGIRGDDSGHGGRTYLRIKNLASTDMSASIDSNAFESIDEISIELGGDSELGTFIQALEFALKVFKESIE